MFVEGGGGFRPQPWQPPPRRPRMTRRQERTLLWLIGINALLLFVAPIGAASIVQAAVALLWGR